jgi:DNA helicase-2/ATP-dependent DNA helicase PcrA
LSVSSATSHLSLGELLAAMRRAHGGELPLNDDQRTALTHDFAQPLWLIAGPGTGKTHTLVWLVLKRLLVDGIAPDRIVLTTFTRKAAAELESRLVVCRQQLVDAGATEAAAIDLSRLRLGTLHGLCAQTLQDERFDPTLRVRVLADELVQQFFVRRSNSPLMNQDDIAFWQRFGIVGERDSFINKAARAAGACKLFNRLTENHIEPEALMASADEDFGRLGEAYAAYRAALEREHRTDQGHLQRHFLNFLDTPDGRAWLADGFTVLVDEYQDTNPIQEEIYFRLAGARGDMTVVGDDDQSLYRFRGATVEALIDFDRACDIYLGRTPTPVYLKENRRSHPGIVNWVNRFIGDHPEMRDPHVRVRAPNKPPLVAAAGVQGNYPPVMALVRNTQVATGAAVAQCIEELFRDGLVQDYSQIALLSFSTRETSHGIEGYTRALRDRGIAVANPRARTAQKDTRLKALLGAMSTLLDPAFDQDALPARLPKNVVTYVEGAREAYRQAAAQHPELRAYVEASQAAVQRTAMRTDERATYLTRKGGRRVTLAGLFFKLLAHEPFASELNDAEGGERIKALNLILSEYESLYDRGELKLAPDMGGGCIEGWTRYNFYAVFVEGIHDGLSDPEDEEVTIRPGAVNVMTIHQSKGLEFEVVFVLRPDKAPWAGDTHILEDAFDAFVKRPTKPPVRRSQEERAGEDAIRLFFVAYSRAKRLLVVAGANPEKWSRQLGATPQGAMIDSTAGLAAMGVHLL